MSRRSALFLLAGITALAGYLRWHQLAVPSLWLDEILHLRVTRELDWSQPWRYLLGLRETRGYAENGSLYYALQSLGQWLFPGDLGVRVAPALVGTLTVPLFGLVAGWFAPTRQRQLVELAAAFALAVAPLHVYYSREGRPYYLLLALAVLLLAALARAVRPVALQRRELVAFAGLCVLGAYIGVHALPLLASAAVLASLLLLTTWRAPSSGTEDGRAVVRHNQIGLLIALGIGIGLCAALYLTRSQHNLPSLELGDAQREIAAAPVFESPLGGETLRRFVASMTTAGTPSLHVGERALLLALLAGSGLVALLLAWRRPGAEGPPGQPGPPDETPYRRLALIGLGMFVLPAAGSLAALVSTGRWYHVRYTATALPAFLLLATLGIVGLAVLGERLARRFTANLPALASRALQPALVVAALVVVVLPNIGPALADPHDKLDWRDIAGYVDRMVLPGEPLVVSTDWPIICLGHYLEQRGREVEFVKIWERSDLGQEVVAERQRGWLLSAGVRKSDHGRTWMHNYVPIWKQSREAFALFYFPDLEDLFATRFSGERRAFFEQEFAARGLGFEFAGNEEPLQGIGWSYPEILPEHHFQWALGEQAELAVPIGRARDVRIEMRAYALAYSGAPDQVISGVKRDWNKLAIDLPAEVWEREVPVLRFFFSDSQRPADVLEGSTDTRDLAAAFDWVRVLEVERGGA